MILEKWEFLNPFVKIGFILGLSFVKTSTLLLSLCLAIFHTVFAQTNSSLSSNPETIKLDSTTFKADKRIPFDKEFILELKVKDDIDIVNIFLYDVEINRVGHSKVIRQLAGGNKNGGIGPRYKLNKVLSGTSLKMFVDPLDPNQNFDIELVQRFSGVNMANLIRLFYFIRQSDPSAYPFFIANLRREVVEPEFDGMVPKHFYTASFPYINTIYNNTVSAILQSIEDVGMLSPYYADVNAIDREHIFSLSVADKMENSDLVALSLIPDAPAFMNILLGINLLASSRRQDVEEFELQKRLKNLNESLEAISKLVIFSQKLLLAHPADGKVIYFAAKIDQLESAIRKSSEIISNYFKALTTVIKGDAHFMFSKLLIMSSNMETIQTGAGYRLIPEVGVANTWPIGHDGIKYIPRIFLGVNINFRSIDKNLKFENVPRSAIFWYRTSLTLGITTKPVQNKDFGDFFNGTSLLAGLNYRIGRGIRISAGPIIYRQKTLNQIVDKQILSLAPFAALSFDVDITQAIDKILGKLF